MRASHGIDRVYKPQRSLYRAHIAAYVRRNMDVTYHPSFHTSFEETDTRD